MHAILDQGYLYYPWFDPDGAHPEEDESAEILSAGLALEAVLEGTRTEEDGVRHAVYLLRERLARAGLAAALRVLLQGPDPRAPPRRRRRRGQA